MNDFSKKTSCVRRLMAILIVGFKRYLLLPMILCIFYIIGAISEKIFNFIGPVPFNFVLGIIIYRIIGGMAIIVMILVWFIALLGLCLIIRDYIAEKRFLSDLKSFSKSFLKIFPTIWDRIKDEPNRFKDGVQRYLETHSK